MEGRSGGYPGAALGQEAAEMRSRDNRIAPPPQPRIVSLLEQLEKLIMLCGHSAECIQAAANRLTGPLPVEAQRATPGESRLKGAEDTLEQRINQSITATERLGQMLEHCVAHLDASV